MISQGCGCTKLFVNDPSAFASSPPPGTLERLESLLINLGEALSKLALAQAQTLTMFEDLSAKFGQTLATKQAVSRPEISTNGAHRL